MLSDTKGFALLEFQFYNSPIKTESSLIAKIQATGFQFYNSPIKTSILNVIIALLRTFQFYNSPIKTI